MLQTAGHLQCPLRLITALVAHLLLAHFSRGQPQLIGPAQPIEATVGSDIILPCHLKPAADVVAKTLEWTRRDLNPRFVFLWRANQDNVNLKNPSYSGRTSLFTDELKRGNMSLKLSNVKPADKGTYICFIPELNINNAIELVVGAASSPVTSLSGIDKDSGRVVLQCDSTGWYPEPELFWLDGEGNLLSAGPPETVRGPDDLYTVSSRVTVEKKHSNSFTCRVTQKKTNQTRETTIQVPDDFFNFKISSVVTGLAVGMALCLVFPVFAFYMWKRCKNRRNTDETDRGRTNSTKSNKSRVESITEEGQKDRLMTHETEQTQFKWPLVSRRRFQMEKQRRIKVTEELNETDGELKEAKRELERKDGQLQDEIQKKKRAEAELKEERTKNTKVQTELQKEKKEREEAEKEVEKLKQELQKQKSEQKGDNNSDSKKA